MECGGGQGIERKGSGEEGGKVQNPELLRQENESGSWSFRRHRT